MPQNPLQQHFRQPKIYISLPSRGAYNRPGVLTGDVTKMPIYGMTGMDEIILKTPDALLTGESTAKIIQSCCPSINDAWDVSMLDSDLILTAIRIATYGNTIEVRHTCTECKSDNEYSLDLNHLIENFSKVEFFNTVRLQDLIVKIQPLTYKQSSEFKVKNFQLQQQLAQAEFLEDKEHQQEVLNELFIKLGEIQNELYVACVESVQTGNTTVTEKDFIKEWLSNSDKSVFDSIKEVIERNQEQLKMPTFPVECPNCKAKTNLSLDLDQSNFFV